MRWRGRLGYFCLLRGPAHGGRRDTGLTSHSICAMKRGCDLAAVFKSYGKHQMCILQREKKKRKWEWNEIPEKYRVLGEGGIFVKRGAEEFDPENVPRR